MTTIYFLFQAWEYLINSDLHKLMTGQLRGVQKTATNDNDEALNFSAHSMVGL